MKFENLNPFEQWMVKSNLNHLEEYGGLEIVVARLKANGYPHVAEAVEELATQDRTHVT
jgi:alanine racemase